MESVTSLGENGTNSQEFPCLERSPQKRSVLMEVTMSKFTILTGLLLGLLAFIGAEPLEAG
jgi:hypothetical protein